MVPVSPADPGQDRALTSDFKEPHPAEELLTFCHLHAKIDPFVKHYNHLRRHESLQNLTPADVYFGHGQTILKQRELIKQKAIETRRLLHHKSAANHHNQMRQIPSWISLRSVREPPTTDIHADSRHPATSRLTDTSAQFGIRNQTGLSIRCED